MKEPIHLTISKEVKKMLVKKRVNISRYVEKLILNDLAVNLQNDQKTPVLSEAKVVSSNLVGPTFSKN